MKMLRRLWNWFRGHTEYDTALDEALSLSATADVQQVNQLLAARLARDVIDERKSNRRWLMFKRIGLAVVFIGMTAAYAVWSAKQLGWRALPSSDRVGVVRIEGAIMNGSLASADSVIPVLRRAFESDRIKAVVLDINSPGGQPAEAERIYVAIASLKAKHPKPVVAAISSVGASAAYLIAVHADKVVSAEYAVVGSIGALIQTWDVHRALDRVDVVQRVYTSGRLKSMLNPFTEPTPEATQKAQELVSEIGAVFVKEVKERRGTKLRAGVDIASGEVWTGRQALDLGLVDAIGTVEQIADTDFGLEVHVLGPNPTGFGFLQSVTDAAVTSVARAVAGPSVQ
jgi:protease-4